MSQNILGYASDISDMTDEFGSQPYIFPTGGGGGGGIAVPIRRDTSGGGGGRFSSAASVASIDSTSSFRSKTYSVANKKELEEDLNIAIENMHSTIEILCDESVDNADAILNADWLDQRSEPRNIDELVANAIAEFDADVASVQIIDENGSATNLQQLKIVENAKIPEMIKKNIKNRRKITYSCYGEKNDISLPKFSWRLAPFATLETQTHEPLETQTHEPLETQTLITEYYNQRISDDRKQQLIHKLAQRMLMENSKFAALKFACANKVPILIPENTSRVKSNASIYYFSQEIFWILQDTPVAEQTAANPKFMWRRKRYSLLSLFSRCPAAIQLFENVYHNLCSVVGNVKISSVGGNPIRAFCLVMNCYFNKNSCDELTPEIILGLDECFSQKLYSADEFNYIKTTTAELCVKLSDTDGIGIELFDATNTDELTQAESQLAKDVLEYSLESHCSEGGDKFTGHNDFILIRSKANTLIDEMSPKLLACYLDRKPIQNKAETLKLAKTVFPGINWFPQMIPSIAFPYTYTSVSSSMSKEIYDEIVKLYCVLQVLKSINADLTQLVSSIISYNSTNSNENYKELRQYTHELCTTVSRNIGSLDRGFSENVRMLAFLSHRVLNSYSEMFGLGNNESTFYATRVNNRILQELPSRFPELGIMPATYASKGKYKGSIRNPHSMALVVPGEDKEVNAILFESVRQSNDGFKSLSSDDMNKSCQSYTLNRLRFGGPIEDIGDDGHDNLSINAIDAASIDAAKAKYNAITSPHWPPNVFGGLFGGSKPKKTRKHRNKKPRKTRKRGKRGMRKTRKGAIA